MAERRLGLKPVEPEEVLQVGVFRDGLDEPAVGHAQDLLEDQRAHGRAHGMRLLARPGGFELFGVGFLQVGPGQVFSEEDPGVVGVEPSFDVEFDGLELGLAVHFFVHGAFSCRLFAAIRFKARRFRANKITKPLKFIGNLQGLQPLSKPYLLMAIRFPQMVSSLSIKTRKSFSNMTLI